MPIIVTGRTSQVVTALAEKAMETGIELVALGRPELDLTDVNIAEAKFALAINAEDPIPAKRPRNSRLSSEKLRDVYGLAPPDWQHSTKTVLNRLIGNPAGVSK